MKLTKKAHYGLGAGLLIAVIALYFLTLDNGLRPDELTGGDLITHQYAQVEARPSNAPGYPLYTMGGWLWFRLGRALFGWALNPIQILSFYSTLWGLASLLILYLILLRVSGRQWWLAPLLTAFYAMTFFFWYYSVTTEQYTSAVFQTLLLIWLAFKWDDRPRDSTLLWLAFVTGTMLANMVTTLFILPPLLWFILFRPSPSTAPSRSVTGGPTPSEPVTLAPPSAIASEQDKVGIILFDYLKRPGFILKAIGLALLPLLSYAFVYIRGAQHPEWRGAGEWPSTWTWFVQFLTIQQGRDELAPGLSTQDLFTDEFPALMGQELTWLVFFGGLLGLIFLGRRRAIFLYSTLLIYFVFSWGYRFGNWFQVIIPAYPIFVIGFAAGIGWLVEIVEQRLRWKIGKLEGGEKGRREEGKMRRFLSSYQLPITNYLSLITRSLVILLLISLISYRVTTNFPHANQRDLRSDTGLDPGWAILADAPETPAIVAGDFPEQVALQYLRTVWGAAPLIEPVEWAEVSALDGLEQDGISFYLTRRAAAAQQEIMWPEVKHPQAAGEQLIALRSSDHFESSAGSIIPLDLTFGDTLKLIGWERLENDYLLPDAVVERGVRANWQIALYWQAAETLSEDYTVSVRPLVGGQLVDVAGETIIQDHQPVWGLYPTSRWRPGEIVRDVYALNLPEGMSPDAAQIVVYRATDTGFKNLAEQVIDLDTSDQSPVNSN